MINRSKQHFQLSKTYMASGIKDRNKIGNEEISHQGIEDKQLTSMDGVIPFSSSLFFAFLIELNLSCKYVGNLKVLEFSTSALETPCQNTENNIIKSTLTSPPLAIISIPESRNRKALYLTFSKRESSN